MSISSTIRARVAAAATSPFGHADYPLAHSLDYPEDPGVCGPDSVSWRVIGDVAAFVGGIRALLIQAAHPEVAAGVADHSSYRTDPLGRLSRTSAYVTATTFGARPEVDEAVTRVRRRHQPVEGRSHRDVPYSATAPELAAWVHNVLTDSFLVAHQNFGDTPLSDRDSNRFVAEQTAIGRLLDADPLPETAAALADWVTMHPDLALSPGMRDAVSFLSHPPLALAQKAGYRLLHAAAVSTIPPRLQDLLGVTPRPGAAAAGRAAVRALRWTLGSSPSWHLALIRTRGVIPPGRFIQPLPTDRAGANGR